MQKKEHTEMINLKDVIREFMLMPSPSGYEKEMAQAMVRHMERYTKEIEVDRAGNVIACFPGNCPNAPKVMVFAHMDQLGFIVRKIEKNGLIQVDRLGGIPEKVLPGLTLLILGMDGTLTEGVFGMKSHHATSADEKYKVDLVTNLLVDIGAESDAEVYSRGIRVGCPVIYRPQFLELLHDHICGTAADNRCGCAALVSVAEQIANTEHAADIYLVGTVWEEFNIRGAVFAARKIQPDLAIGMDVVFCGDTPDLASKYDLHMGGGPAVGMYNFHGRGTLNGCIGHKGLYLHARKMAEAQQIPLQEFASVGMLTDTAYVQMEGQYVGCIDMGFPARYTHTPIESASVQDIQKLADLVAAMVLHIDETFPLGRFDA